VQQQVEDVLAAGARCDGHVFNLGHGVLPDTDPGVLGRVVEVVQSWAPERTSGPSPTEPD
jgi:uroporphyrinogen decarboxylase